MQWEHHIASSAKKNHGGFEALVPRGRFNPASHRQLEQRTYGVMEFSISTGDLRSWWEMQALHSPNCSISWSHRHIWGRNIPIPAPLPDSSDLSLVLQNTAISKEQRRMFQYRGNCKWRRQDWNTRDLCIAELKTWKLSRGQSRKRLPSLPCLWRVNWASVSILSKHLATINDVS